MSRRRRRRWADVCWSRTRRLICASATRPFPSPSFSRSWCGAPAAACYATSTTSMSPAPISAVTPWITSTPCRRPPSARSISPVTPASCAAARRCSSTITARPSRPRSGGSIAARSGASAWSRASSNGTRRCRRSRFCSRKRASPRAWRARRPTPMLALREVQAAFRRGLLDGDDSALAALVAADGIAATERLAVYRNNVQTSLTDALRDTFPAVCRIVDERFFAYAAHAFLTGYPPRRACLAEYGARFEWLMNRAAHAADAEALAPSSLAGVAAADAPRLVFRLDPSFGFLASPWPVDRIWRLNRPGAQGDETVDLAAGGVRLEIRRRGPDVVFRALEGATFAFRQAIAAGATLDASTATAFAADARFDLGAAVADLFRDGAVVAFTLAPEAVP